MKTLTRRDFLRLAAMGAGGALLAACAPKSTVAPEEPEEKAPEEKVEEEPTPVPAEPMTVVYQSWGTEEKWASEGRCFQPFYDAHPEIDVEFVGLAWGPYWQRILTSFAGGEPVDMFRMEFWKAHAYYSRDVILPLDDYFAGDGIAPEEEFLDIQEQSVYQGTWYGTPRGATGNHVIYYNRDMFDKAGIEWPEKTPNWTWDDLLEIADELTNVTGDIETDVWGFDTAKITNDFNGGQELVWGRGGRLFDEDYTKCLINTAEAIEGLQWLADLRNKHGVAPYPAQLPEGMGDAFLVQKVAMNQTGGFMINIYKTIEDFDWGIATVPAGPVRQVAYSKPNATVITAACKYPDAAWQLLKFINSEDTNKCEALEGLWPPALQSVLMSDWYLTRDTAPYDMSPTVPGLLCDGQAPQLSPYAMQARTIMQNELDPVWSGDATIAEVAPIIEEKVNELLASEEPPELS
jgi:multiple sugar transport system substrate-binding protein